MNSVNNVFDKSCASADSGAEEFSISNSASDKANSAACNAITLSRSFLAALSPMSASLVDDVANSSTIINMTNVTASDAPFS